MVVLPVTCTAQAIRIPDRNFANKDCPERVFRRQRDQENLCHVDLKSIYAPGILDEMKMNPWEKNKKTEGREWRTQTSELMTG